MGQALQTGDALKILRNMEAVGDDGELHTFREDLEAMILDHLPRTPEDVVAVLEVLISNLGAGPRSDGRDLVALANLKGWARGLVVRHLTVIECESLTAIERKVA